jgi:hypothetical protein
MFALLAEVTNSGTLEIVIAAMVLFGKNATKNVIKKQHKKCIVLSNHIERILSFTMVSRLPHITSLPSSAMAVRNN